MKLNKLKLVAAITASIMVSPLAMAGATSNSVERSTQTVEPINSTATTKANNQVVIEDSVEVNTVSPMNNAPEDDIETSEEYSDVMLKDEPAADRLGVVAFEAGSVELSDTSEETLKDIAQSLDTDSPAMLMIEVSDPIQIVVTEKQQDINETPQINSDDAQSASESQKESMTQRAQHIRDFFENQGVTVQTMTIDDQTVADSSSTPDKKMQSKDEKATADAEKQDADLQKIRIVIKQVEMKEEVTTL